ncbi:hypothetical protein SEPCBS119000_006799, partial [Sporothrix epigloea]
MVGPSNGTLGVSPAISAILAEQERRASLNSAFVKEVYEAMSKVARKFSPADAESLNIQEFTDGFLSAFLATDKTPIGNSRFHAPLPTRTPASTPFAAPPAKPLASAHLPTRSTTQPPTAHLPPRPATQQATVPSNTKSSYAA